MRGNLRQFASRLEAVNKIYGSRILISQATAAALDEEFVLREVDRLTVIGQTVSQVVFEVMGKREGLTRQQELLRARYSEGLGAYRACRWEQARNLFNAALEISPEDGPSQAFLDRIDRFQTSPPPPDWNGSWQMEHK
jgi:hypothetical protein